MIYTISRSTPTEPTVWPFTDKDYREKSKPLTIAEYHALPVSAPLTIAEYQALPVEQPLTLTEYLSQQ